MRRTLRFTSYDEILADAEALAAKGYDRAGAWGLGQACDHLAKTMERSLDGFPDKMPLPFRVLARWVALGGILKHRQTNRKFPAPAYLQPPDAADDRAGLDRLRSAVGRLKGHAGPMQVHPAFGKVTPEQWREIHLWHSEHHLSYLSPRA
jgi:hypothetical protein